MAGTEAPSIHFGSPEARWVLAATILGSGIVFLDGSVVNVALPAIGRDFGIGVSGLQWTISGYLVMLTALLLFGGSLGDLYGRRRIFVIGLAGFTAASVLCAVAPTIGVLIAARGLQGVGGALLVPGSLAIISASFAVNDRSRAVGAWSGLAGVSTALAPFLGGWLIDAVSWRMVFLVNIPLAAAAAWMALRHVPETVDPGAGRRPDWLGALAVSVGLAGIAYALIEGPERMTARVVVAIVLGVAGITGFVYVESRVAHPMLPLSVFRSSQFVGANLTTLAVYGALGGAMFLLVLQLQLVLGYSALEAGAAMLPVTVLLLFLSARSGALAQRIGPRLPMTVGPILVGIGLFWFSGLRPGDQYVTAFLPPALVFGLGLTATVAPLTATVLASVDEHHVGAASGTNNAVARGAGLLAVALLPAIAHLDTAAPADFSSGFATGMRIAAVVAMGGGVIAWVTIRTAREARAAEPPAVHVCGPVNTVLRPGTPRVEATHP